LPKFFEWLKVEVEKATSGPKRLLEDVINASKSPEKVATSSRIMYAHGMHLWVQSAEEEKVTCDSGIATSILHCGRRTLNKMGNRESFEYMG